MRHFEINPILNFQPLLSFATLNKSKTKTILLVATNYSQLYQEQGGA